MAEPLTLYRPTGRDELRLVVEALYMAWPPRLPEQPIFYPVLNESYARQIARDWNTKDGATGYVTRFEVEGDYASRFEVHQVGGREHIELWVSADELDEFNGRIVGEIEVIAAYRGDPPAEITLPAAVLPPKWTVNRMAEVAGVAGVVLAPGVWPASDGTSVPATPLNPIGIVCTGNPSIR